MIPALALAALISPLATPAPPPRRIAFELQLEKPPAEVWNLWATAEGAMRFLAPRVVVEPRVGGKYEVAFDLDTDPEGAFHGTKGCRILRLVPGREIAFEWRFPPLGKELGDPPFPTRVEVTLAEVPGEPGQTRLSFSHAGFPSGGAWDKAYEIFRDQNWPLVLNRLVVLTRDGAGPQWTATPGKEADTLDRYVVKGASVPRPPADVWRSWTTAEGLEAFFAAKARVEPRPGGPFELLFDLTAPEGSRGCEGCRVVAVHEPRLLAFDWSEPPSLPALRFVRTQVNVAFAARADGGTDVRITAMGFGRGPDWVAAHAYFDRAWGTVLGWLRDGRPRPEAKGEGR